MRINDLVNYRFLRRVVLITFLMTLLGLKTYGYEIFYPTDKNSTTTYDYGLFIGKARNSEIITINNEKVFVASNGAFAHSVKLKDGENRVFIRSNYSTKVYNVSKKTIATKVQKDVIQQNNYIALVNKDNAPLRSAPEDIGFNIISYLFKDTRVIIDGEKDDYYRVFLSKDKKAWIAKDDVVKNLNQEFKPASFINTESQRYKNATVQTISFTENLPYTIEENEKELLFKIYNPELSEASVYTLNILKPKNYFYNVTLKDGFYTFKVSEVPKSIADCTIIVDAGHGGTQKGALGCLGDEEKNINLKIALELQKILKEKGANVIMTRECDGTISLKDRIIIAKENSADIFLSIHMNSIGNVPFDNSKHRGTSLYYFNQNSKDLATILEKSISKAAGTKRNGVKTASFAVIRPANYVGVLIETAYMINPSDTLLYTQENFASNVAKGIFVGLEEFVQK